MFSIKTRLILSYSLMFEIVLMGYSVYIHHTMKEAAIATLDTRLESTAGRFEDELEENFHDKHLIDSTDILLAKKQTPPQFSIRLWDSTGLLVYSDSLFAAGHEDALNPELRGSKRFDDILYRGQDFRTVYLPVTISQRIFYTAQFGASLKEIESSLDHLQTIFYISFPLAFLLSAIAGYLIVRVGFRPLTVMIDSAKNISERNLEERLPTPQTNDEVRTLGITFNRMIERIESAFRSQRQFIADASHEMRSPLTIINAELEFAKRGLGEGDVKESIGISLEAVDHLKRITEDLLLLARLEAHYGSLRLQRFRLDEVIMECIRNVKHIGGKKGTTVDASMIQEIECFGDKEKISSLVAILLDNAIKYSFERTTVSIDLRRTETQEISLQITNHGPGIPPAEIPNVFERFFRASSIRNDYTGSGLGLAIARRITELHSGKIVVISEPEKVTTFTILLPSGHPARG